MGESKSPALPLGDGASVIISIFDPPLFVKPFSAQNPLLRLDAAGGECSTVVVYTSTSGKLAALPESPVMEGYTFNGWYTEMVGGSKVSTSTVFAGDTTIYAHWTVKSGTSAGSTAPVQPAAPSIKQHLGTVLVAGILLTTLAAAIAAGM